MHAAVTCTACLPHAWSVLYLSIAQELLDSLPKCKQLLETFRASPNMQNKTPLAIVHEYASRFNLEVRHACIQASDSGSALLCI